MSPASADARANDAPLLEVRDLHVGFTRSDGAGSLGFAVQGAGFALYAGEIFCLAGESGCGKSVTAHAVLGLLSTPPAYCTQGSVLFEGRDVLRLSPEELRLWRGTETGMIFQDPMTALNPVMRVEEQIIEGACLHLRLSRKEALERAEALLEQAGIADPAACLRAFPHELSGGMRQRVMIASALMTSPRLLVADEPTTALDVTVQRQVLDLMRGLCAARGTALLLITHDLGVVRRMADRAAVMYAGRVVEQGPAKDILESPAHPYTQGLIASRPATALQKSGERRRLAPIPGSVPGLWNRPQGCLFHPRCPKVEDRCRRREPDLLPVKGAENRVCRCVLTQCFELRQE